MAHAARAAGEMPTTAHDGTRHEDVRWARGQDGMVLPVPRTLAAITPRWMTAALARDVPGAVVASVRLGEVVTGTNARARAALTYSAGSGPGSVFLKLSGTVVSRLALEALGATEVEARLAGSGAVLPLTHPRFLAGALDRRRLAAVVVCEDVVAGGGRPHDPRTPLDPRAVRSGLEGLARLHAAYWGLPMPPSLAFLRPWRLGPVWAQVSALSLSRGMRRLQQVSTPHSALPPTLRAAALGAQFARSAVEAGAGPQTLLHGDPHPGNTYEQADGVTGFYDWQLARVGHWSHDVGYFLVGSLSVADRRAHERDLLAAYLEALGAAGAPVPPGADAWTRYRATPAFGLATWLHTLSFGVFQPVAVCTATITRFAAAYEDLGTAWAAGGRDP